MKYNVGLMRFLLAGILFLSCALHLQSQDGFRKVRKRSANMLEINSALLKTIYSFKPVKYDTIPQPGPDPILIASYRETDLIPELFNAVFSERVKVYNPNFWGTVPQLIDRESYEEFDTLQVLKYLSAGWDTSYMMENDGSMRGIPEYRRIPFEEIAGIFFYESWWLDLKTSRMYKDIIAYVPIREYTNTVYDGYEETEIRRRLLFMVIPEWSSGEEKPVKLKRSDFRLIKRDIEYETRLHNKAYEQYLYREDDYGQISQAEFNEWQYHTFDFYRHFDPDLFLEKLISSVLKGSLKAYHAGIKTEPLTYEEFSKKILNFQGNKIEWDELKGNPEGSFISGSALGPEDYPLSDLNSVTFHEDWYFNPDNLYIYKEVKGITINRTESKFDNYTGEFIQGSVEPLFSIWFE